MKRKLFTILLAAIAVVCFAIGLAACSSKKDNGDSARKIELGDTQERVEQILGTPAEKQSDTLWLYYGKEYTELNNKLEKNTEQLLAAMEKGDSDKAQKLFKENLELEEKLANLTYEYTEIIFSRKTDGGQTVYTVSKVYYDSMHKAEDEPEKQLMSVKLAKDAGYYIDETKGENYIVIVNDEMSTDNSYKAEYLDGSYSLGYITNATLTTDGGTTLKWSDKFGKYELSQGIFNIGTISSDGVLTCDGSYLKKFVLPAHVTKISNERYVPHATIMEVEEGNTVFHANGNCIIETETKTLVAGGKTSVIPTDGSVTKIGNRAFERCHMTTISIPNTITHIGKYSFYSTGLESIIIPESVTYLGDGAFSTCQLTSVTIPHSITEIPSSLFSNNEGTLTSVTMHDGITSIGAGAFWACHKLSNITLPANLKFLGERAFGSCGSINDITIPNSVEFIEQDVFIDTGYYKNESNWENGVLYNGKYLLKANSTVTGEYTVKSGTVSIAGYAFSASKVEKINIPASVKYLSAYALNTNSSFAEADLTFANEDGWGFYRKLGEERNEVADVYSISDWPNNYYYWERLS